MVADFDQRETVVATVPRARLADALSAIHGAGLGRQVSVIDPARGDVAGRFTRLGVSNVPEFPRTDVDVVFIVAPCPGRIGPTEKLLIGAGALAIDHCGR